MSDLEDSANKMLTEPAPPAGLDPPPPQLRAPVDQGSTEGPPAPEALPQPEAPVVLPPAAGGPADILSGMPWLRPGDGAELQTDLRDLRACNNCGGPIPVAAARCPKCQCFAPKHPSTRKPRKGDVEEIHRSLVNEYAPRTTVLREASLNLARAYVQLRVIPAGSPEWARTLDQAQGLSEVLERSRPASAAAAITNLEDLNPDQLVAHAERVLHMAKLARDAKRDGDAYLAQASGTAGLSVQAAASEGVALTSAPAPEPERCPYCNRPQPECTQLREEQPDVWEVLCSRHPDVIKQRDERATREMMMQIGKPLPDWYR